MARERNKTRNKSVPNQQYGQHRRPFIKTYPGTGLGDKKTRGCERKKPPRTIKTIKKDGTTDKVSSSQGPDY